MSIQNSDSEKNNVTQEDDSESVDAPEIDLDEIIASLGEPKVKPPSGQSTLFGGGQ